MGGGGCWRWVHPASIATKKLGLRDDTRTCMSHRLRRVRADTRVCGFVSGSERVWNLSAGPRAGSAFPPDPRAWRPSARSSLRRRCTFGSQVTRGQDGRVLPSKTFPGKPSPEPPSAATLEERIVKPGTGRLLLGGWRFWKGPASVLPAC